ncbi:bifunctional diguanylate cyclase/phosphodiesterase [Arcobacter roscoffensis]|uniref:EAL domain-containing protein n=1 Tax=Arcobacter roscoffensis TaxID=2961520 RepID=A0ABY5E468_9BACT|nr:EAL domain-containing protein [Arcobacter roscoffensis]UTJ05570.1 EAL domain-containing protein [Arcobacter roscoffensis]
MIISSILKPFNKSIKNRVVLQVSGLIATAIILMITMVSFMMVNNINTELNKLLKNKTLDSQKRLEQRLSYLIESSIILSKNELIINSLIDKQTKEKVLNILVKNYMQDKSVVSLSVVDFDGNAIFKSLKKIPKYNSSTKLRATLALGEITTYIKNDTNNIVVIVPISYYNTTQGALITVFDLNAIGKNITLKNNTYDYLKLKHLDNMIFSYNYQDDTKYYSYVTKSHNNNYYIKKLGIDVELGTQSSKYEEPIKEALIRLISIGILFILAGLLISQVLAKEITEPILRLYHKVKSSNKDTLCSPIGTNDELEQLAQAFDEKSLKLQYQVEHDSLTDLPNRVLLLDRINQAIKHSNNINKKLVIFFIDLDHFKEINDSLGHTTGDELLKKVSIILTNITKEHTNTVARLGGDEFVVFVENISTNEQIIDIAQNIMDSFSLSKIINGYELFISCSIGVSVFPEDGKTTEALIKNADAAMYKAKELGRNNYQFYSKEMTKKAMERVEIEKELRNAIQNEEFEVHFQPQISIKNESIIGVEALVRWMHPQKGMISPIKFIPLAEEIGVIESIDKIVMKKAMKSFVEIKQKGFDLGTLSLNVSMLQINKDNNFIKDLKQIIEDTKIDTTKIIIEITETQVMKDINKTIKILEEIRSLGMKIAIDDFGTGQSSLSYLKKLPINKIKIDQSFIRDLPQDKDDYELTKAIIAIAKSMNMNLIAEGVETKEQAELLLEEGCFEAQGYYYYKPLGIKALKQVIGLS